MQLTWPDGYSRKVLRTLQHEKEHYNVRIFFSFIVQAHRCIGASAAEPSCAEVTLLSIALLITDLRYHVIFSYLFCLRNQCHAIVRLDCNENVYICSLFCQLIKYYSLYWNTKNERECNTATH